MSRTWAGGSTTQWRKLRAAVLLANQNENRGRCVLQVEGVCEGQATQVHHTRGKRHGDDPKHLVAACAACNRAVGDPTKGDVPHRPVSRW